VSKPGEDGWFPICAACGLGNVHCVVCLDPTCHEKHQGKVIEGAREKYLEEARHAWQLCQFCDNYVCSDGGAFGSYALCVECWNDYARKGELPPIAR
jgi:hypothetical protein